MELEGLREELKQLTIQEAAQAEQAQRLEGIGKASDAFHLALQHIFHPISSNLTSYFINFSAYFMLFQASETEKEERSEAPESSAAPSGPPRLAELVRSHSGKLFQAHLCHCNCY